MLTKLEWGMAAGSDRQFDDAVAIATTQAVDRDYLAEWAHEIGVFDQLQAALRKADSLRTGEG